jgi:hypothetical protein
LTFHMIPSTMTALSTKMKMTTFLRLFLFATTLTYFHTLAGAYEESDVASEVRDAEEANNQCSVDGSCTVDDDSSTSAVECGIWLAMSSLPGTGIGMFAGRSFNKGENLMRGLGDHCVPIVDIGFLHKDAYFLWDEYTWVRKRKLIIVLTFRIHILIDFACVSQMERMPSI